jgi:hypothetical protein
MAAVYPTSVVTFTTKENKVDVYDAAHINDLQNEVVALQTYTGTNPHGSLSSLTERLAVMMSADGSIVNSNAFPATGLVDGQIFYRTDENILYVYNGSSWDSQGQTLSNVIFHWGLSGGDPDQAANGAGMILNDSFTAASTEIMLGYWGAAVSGTGSIRLFSGKWTRVAGVSTISIYGRIWASVDDVHIVAAIGSATSFSSLVSTNFPTWANFDLDVSGLGVGTTHNVIIYLRRDSGVASAMLYTDEIWGFGS